MSQETIWTHVPVPEDFPLQGIKDRFEQRAQIVWGDYGTDLSHIFKQLDDGRYGTSLVHFAWMLYLDLALQHFNGV